MPVDRRSSIEAMGFGRFLERELGSDDGTHGATFPQAQDVPGRPLHEGRVATEEAAEVEAVNPDVAPDEPGGG